jgi:uncharacterized protein YjiS (DUF1127 family)
MKATMRRQLKRLRRSLIALAPVVGRWEDRIAALRRVRATVRALSVLDDRTLHDLGLGRSEVFSGHRAHWPGPHGRATSPA